MSLPAVENLLYPAKISLSFLRWDGDVVDLVTVNII